jgi:hypothetical protein
LYGLSVLLYVEKNGLLGGVAAEHIVFGCCHLREFPAGDRPFQNLRNDLRDDSIQKTHVGYINFTGATA